MYYPNPTSTNLEKKSKSRTSKSNRNPRESSNTEEVVMETVVLSSRWCVSKWLVALPIPKLVLKESIKTCTRSLLNSKQLRLNSKFNLKQILSVPAWSLQQKLKMFLVFKIQACRLNPISIRNLANLIPKKWLMTVDPTGELVSSITTMTRTSILLSKAWSNRAAATTSTVSSRFRRSLWANTPIEEKRRRAVKLFLVIRPTVDRSSPNLIHL